MTNLLENSSKKAVNYTDVLYSKEITGFNGYSNSTSAAIKITVDPGGVIKAGNSEFAGAVPGRIQFFTAKDDGKLRQVGEFDSGGRFITHEHWSVTSSPSGTPLLLMSNSDSTYNEAALQLRRSRGTYMVPTSVNENDKIFKIAWYAHDGQSYKESSAIDVSIDGTVSLGNVPSSFCFKTFDTTSGHLSATMIVNSDKSISVQSLSALQIDSSIVFNSPIALKTYKNKEHRDTDICAPAAGALIFLLDIDSVQVYTNRSGWKNLI